MYALCAVSVAGRQLLAAGDVGTVRLWDLAANSSPQVVHIQHRVTALTSTRSGDTVAGLSDGLLALRFASEPPKAGFNGRAS